MKTQAKKKIHMDFLNQCPSSHKKLTIYHDDPEIKKKTKTICIHVLHKNKCQG